MTAQQAAGAGKREEQGLTLQSNFRGGRKTDVYANQNFGKVLNSGTMLSSVRLMGFEFTELNLSRGTFEEDKASINTKTYSNSGSLFILQEGEC